MIHIPEKQSTFNKVVTAIDRIGFPIVVTLILLYMIHFELGAIVSELQEIKNILNQKSKIIREYRNEKKSLENNIRINNDGNRIDPGGY